MIKQNGESKEQKETPQIFSKFDPLEGVSTEYLEKQIDELVFGLYGLGEEEVGVVVG